jgi:hypothetical protein
VPCCWFEVEVASGVRGQAEGIGFKTRALSGVWDTTVMTRFVTAVSSGGSIIAAVEVGGGDA